MNSTESDPTPSTIDLGADHEERKRLNFWHRGRLPLNKKVLRCGRELSPAAKLVFLYLIERAGDGNVYARQLTICDDLGIDGKTLRKCLGALTDRGFITPEERPGLRQALQYRVNLEVIYEWVDSGKNSREEPGDSPATDRKQFPQFAGDSPATPTDQETVTGTVTGDSRAPARARTREDIINTVLLELNREGNESLAVELGILLDAHGEEAFLHAKAAVVMHGPRGRKKPWPSALQEHLPDTPGPPPRKSRHADGMLLPAAEVSRRAQAAADKTMESIVQDYRDKGVPEEMLAHFVEACDGPAGGMGIMQGIEDWLEGRTD